GGGRAHLRRAAEPRREPRAAGVRGGRRGRADAGPGDDGAGARSSLCARAEHVPGGRARATGARRGASPVRTALLVLATLALASTTHAQEGLEAPEEAEAVETGAPTDDAQPGTDATSESEARAEIRQPGEPP